MSSQSLLFPDQSHINRVRDALWERPNGRASIMVGAGFSRNAETTGPSVGDIPLWRDIAREMFHRLYPRYADHNPQNADPDPVSAYDALRLAQEYETGFGRGDLHKFLQEIVRDNEFNPGDIHQRLLRLPWRDVFTTNWDTLMERTIPCITERAYSVVRNMNEIPLMSQPRIVKLHGALPSQFPLIFTEEDYRTYPTKFAPFVNTVQQSMMETVFCLIGFSGDDPNFLQWSGWVRDNLGAAAPKIYLAGWLDLSNHRRRMLEDRDVVPIDLARHPKSQRWPEHLRHEYATRWVLHTLENGKPYDQTTWPSPLVKDKSDIPELLQPVEVLASTVPQMQPERKRSSENPFDEREKIGQIRKTLKVWKNNRRLYPGWLAFPSSQERGELSRRTNDWEQPILNAIPDLTPVERLHAIRELIWRREILLEPFTQQLVETAEEVLQLIDCEKHTIGGAVEARSNWTDIREAWRTVGLSLLTDARIDCKSALFEHRLDALKPFANDHIDVTHRMQHERCLWDIFSLGFESLNQRLSNWEVTNCDPIWMLRKAALLTEAGRTDESKSLVQTALNLIRENYARNSSLANASRESWALASALTSENQQDFRRRWDELASLKCDAMQEIDLSTRAMHQNNKEDEAPPFDLGVRRSSGIRISNENHYRIIAAYRGVRLLEVAGLPPTNNPSGKYFMSTTLGQREILISATEELVTIAPELAVRLVLRASSDEGDKTLERVVARTRIATLSKESVKALAEICNSVINYALPRLNLADSPSLVNPWVRRTRVALEVLSRLVLRLPADSVAAVLELGLEFLRNSDIRGNVLLGRPVSNLLGRSWDALSDEHRARYALCLLATPLEGLDGFAADPGYQDPGSLVINSDVGLIRSSDNENQFQDVVKFVISKLKSEENQVREQATFRLLTLMNARCLTASEIDDTANALWAKDDPILGNPTSTKLPEWVFFVLPELNVGQAEKSFRKKWLAVDSDLGEDMALAGNVLGQVGMALDMSTRHEYSLPLSSEEQKHLLDCVLKVAESLLKGAWSSRGILPSGITRGIRSSLDKIEIPKANAERLYEVASIMRDLPSASERHPFFNVNELQTSISYAVMVGLIKAMPDRVEDVSSWIRLGLTSDDDLQVSQAMSTLQSWMSVAVSDSNFIIPPPEDLVREIGVVIATRRKVALPSALSAANWVFESGDTCHQETISQLVLQGLFYLIEELRYDRQHDDGNRVPTLRLLCAQLAKSVAEKGYATSPPISQWLEMARDDPLPEVRYAITPDEQDVV